MADGTLRIAIYHNLHSGGARRVVAEHTRRLAARHSVELFSLSSAEHRFAEGDGPAAKRTILPHRKQRWLRSPFGRLNTLVGMAYVLRLDRAGREVARLIDGGGFDLVLAHPCQFTQAPLVLRWLRTPSLYYCHELPRMLYEPPIERPYNRPSAMRRLGDRLDPLPGLTRSFYRLADRSAAAGARHIAVNSRFTAGNVERAYGRRAPVCYLGVDGARFSPRPQPRERVVLSVGALTPAKGFDFVVRALGALGAEVRPPLTIISNYQDPQERGYLEALAAEHGVALRLLAGVSETELTDWYARAGCVAYAPINEPFGFVPLEAMAAGAALVGIAEGGVGETVQHGITGITAPREPRAFGRAVLSVLDNAQLADGLGRTARERALHDWTWERHIAELEGLLAEAAGVAPATGRGSNWRVAAS